MTLSDDELRASLERVAATAPTLDLAAAARIVASTPQRGITRRTRLIGLASAAASVAAALAVFGSLAFRDDVPASQSPGASSAAIGTASPSTSPSSSPIAERWTDLVWEATDPAPFALAGTTLITAGVADGNGFLAVGNTRDAEDKSHQLWRSPDGRAWTAVDTDWPATAQLDQILNFGTGFIMISRQEVPNPTTAQGSTQDRVWWSEDGVTWVERTPEASEGLVFGSAAAGPSGVLIRARDVNDNEYWLRSDAQLNWTRIDAGWPDDAAVFGVASSGVGWLAYGATGVGSATTAGAIWTSSDAATWTPATIDDPGGSINDVRSIGNRLIALGSQRGLQCEGCLGGPILLGLDLVTWVSSDGRSWQRASEHEIGSLRAGDVIMAQGLVAAGNDRILAFESTSDGRLGVGQTVDGFGWSEVRVLNGQSSTVGGLTFAPEFDAPVIIGPHGLVAFGHDATFRSLVPRYAEGTSSSRNDLPTFAPRPEPTTNDVPCPGTEPCGP